MFVESYRSSLYKRLEIICGLPQVWILKWFITCYSSTYPYLEETVLLLHFLFLYSYWSCALWTWLREVIAWQSVSIKCLHRSPFSILLITCIMCFNQYAPCQSSVYPIQADSLWCQATKATINSVDCIQRQWLDRSFLAAVQHYVFPRHMQWGQICMKFHLLEHVNKVKPGEERREIIPMSPVLV